MGPLVGTLVVPSEEGKTAPVELQHWVGTQQALPEETEPGGLEHRAGIQQVLPEWADTQGCSFDTLVVLVKAEIFEEQSG